MPSKAPEHAVVALLKQCYTNPRCLTVQIRGTPQTTTVRSYHSSKSYRQPKHHRDLRIRPQSRYSRIHTTSQKRSQTAYDPNFPIFEPPNQLSPVTFAKPHNDSNSGGSAKPNSIAILGGGITGLAAAHYVARELPHLNITIYEASNRLGGWLQSEQVDVGNGRNILFEAGPRTLRPNTPASLTTIELIHDLGLKDEVVVNPKDSIAALNRFIYYPDRLVRMPGPGQSLFANIWTVISEDVFKGNWSAWQEHNRPPRQSSLSDESISSFLTRRLGTPDIGNNIVSAVMHGIYAGDINKLSARSILSKLWSMEAVAGSVTKAMLDNLFQRNKLMLSPDVDLIRDLQNKFSDDLLRVLNGASVYSFKGGISALTNALEKSLRANPKVRFRIGHPVSSIDHEGGVKITRSETKSSSKYDLCISTISSKALSSASIPPLPTLALTQFVTVMVVNLYYSDPDILPEHGFGYLIPRSIPYEQNLECALGVVFDSDAFEGQDSTSGTKVTVMLGGHWWDDFESYPDEEEGAAMAKNILARHLKITHEPEKIRVRLQRDCIPQYTVGHATRMDRAHLEVLKGYNSQLRVAGNSYTGVGLNDCVRSARQVVMNIKNEVGGLPQHRTGLEEIASEKWVMFKM